jgi:hypothetical protein
MRYRIIATKGTDGVGSVALSAIEALEKLLELEQIGRHEITVLGEDGKEVSRAELFETAQQQYKRQRSGRPASSL